MNETIYLSSNYNISISESDHPDYYLVDFILCDFDFNGNGVKLNRDTIETWMNTLVMNPVVGKIQGSDFTTHQYKNGKFGTDAFGVFESVRIENIDGKDYLMGTARVWKRFEKACSILIQRFKSGQGLHTSWEVSVLDSSFDEQGRKIINSGILLGHCLLSRKTPPAYDCSRVIDVAEQTLEEQFIEFSQALQEDINNIKGGEEMENENFISKEQHDTEVSSLAKSIATKEEEISSLKAELEKAKAELSEKDGQIIKLGETINSQKETIAERDNLISELEPVKAEMERLKAEKEARELAEKQEAMKSYVISTKYFTSEEIEANEEMKNAIAELDEAKVNSLIAKKVIAEAEISKKKCAEEECPKCGKNPCECSKKKCAEEDEEAKKKCAEDEEESKKKCSELETSEAHIDINLSNNGEGNIKTTSIASLLAKRNKRF